MEPEVTLLGFGRSLASASQDGSFAQINPRFCTQVGHAAHAHEL